MREPAVAQIIPFPTRRPAPPPAPAASPATEGQDRLARALASLNAALDEQRTAMAAWRGALSELKQTTEGLSGGLQRYHASLGALGDKVATLNQEAVRLEAWADQVLTQP